MQINSVIPATQIDASTIQVQVVDPTTVPTSPNTLKALITDYAQKNLTSPVSGYTDIDLITIKLGALTETFVGGQFITTLHGDGLSSPSSPFYSFCVDVFHGIIPGSDYPVLPLPASTSLTNGAEISYLYNHFNTSFGSPLSAHRCGWTPTGNLGARVPWPHSFVDSPFDGRWRRQRYRRFSGCHCCRAKLSRACVWQR